MTHPISIEADHPRRLHVGEWDVDPGAHELSHAGKTVRIEPKVMALLVLLAEHAGKTVSRDALLDALWPDVVVTEDALSQAVSKLRRTLRDDPQTPRYVETIPKAGYRLIAPVEVMQAEPEDERATEAEPARRVWRPRPLSTLAVVVLALVLLVLGVRWWTEPAVPASRPLTHLPGVETHPALSPDGRFLAFIAAPRGAGGGTDLYVQGLDDPAPRRLTETPDEERHPTWEPSGRLAFLRCTGLRCGVYTMSALGGGTRRLSTADVGPWGLSGQADGRGLTAVARETPEAPYHIVGIDPETGATRPLTVPPEHALGDLHPAISPGDDRVAFVRHGPDGAEDVFVQPLRPGANAVQITQGGQPIYGLAWTPDGRTLIVSTNRDDGEALWRVPVDGGPQTRVPLATAAAPYRPALAADRLIFEARTEEVNLYRLDLAENGPPQPVLVSTSAATQPALSPDGTRLAFISGRSGVPALWTARTDGTDLVALTDFRGARLGAPRWSPDGRHIVFEAQQEGQAALYLVDAGGGSVRRLTADIGYALGPRWGPGGRFVYFGANLSGDWRVWRVSVAGGRPEPVSPPGGFVGEPTMDGRALLFSRADAPGLWRMPLPAGPAIRLDSTLALADWGNWGVTETGLFVLERDSDSTRLVRLDPEMGLRTVVRSDLGPVPSREPALGFSRDGRSIVLARTDQVESALVLIEPFR